MFNKFRAFAIAAAVTAGVPLTLSLSAPSAFGQAVTFATFNQVDEDDVIRMVNGTGGFVGPTSRLGTYDAAGNFISSGIPVDFTYLVSNGTMTQGTAISALMTMTATVSAPAVVQDPDADPITPGNQPQVLQRFTSFSMVFTLNEDNTSPLFGDNGANLLTITGTTRFIGDSSTGSMNVTELAASNAPFDIGYSSDYLIFSPTFNNRNYALGINNINPIVNVDNSNGTDPNLVDDPNDGYLRSFTSNISGQFAADPGPMSTIPEPSSVALLALGSGLGVTVTLRRRAKRVTVKDVMPV